MKDRDIKILEMYNDGYGSNEIAAIVGCSVGTVYNALKRENQETRSGYHGIKKDFVNEVIKRYKNNESIFSICNTLGTYQEKVKRILRENNVDVISYSKRNNPGFVENYFESIDTNDKAYWLGWLITDGCINKTSISIALKSCDTYILEQFQRDLGLNGKIKPFSGKYSRLMFWSRKMVNDLAKYGIVENKTFTVDLPHINDEFVPALLRGCIDGDGGISYFEYNRRKDAELSFAGNEKCVRSFSKLIHNSIGMDEKPLTINNSIFRVRWSSKSDIVKICDKLYESSDEHRLERKYDNYLKIKSLVYEN